MKINTILDEIGYSKCKGGMMAGNEHWCKPIDTWKAYFSHWVMTPGPEELLEISVFYDFTFVYGDQNLVDELHHYVHKELKTTDIFSHLMAIAWMPFAPEKNYHPENLTNLKTLLMPLTGLVRLYSISNGITSTGTLDRIAGLLQAGIFDRHMAVSLIEAWQNLTGIRLQFQSGQIINAIPPDNQLDLRLLDEYRRFQIEKAVESIQRLVKKAELDFRTRSV
jgi:CBS domain-containing protein